MLELYARVTRGWSCMPELQGVEVVCKGYTGLELNARVTRGWSCMPGLQGLEFCARVARVGVLCQGRKGWSSMPGLQGVGFLCQGCGEVELYGSAVRVKR